MSQAVYPVLPGISYGTLKIPTFKTDIKTTPSGREFRGAQMQYPLYKYTLIYEFLRDTATAQEWRTLIGFYAARQGCFDSFLFDDTDDHSVTGQQFGIGDGLTTTFQLVRALGGNVEPVYDLNGGTSIYVNGSGVGNYTVNATGGVTFATAPAYGAPITWTGNYYWRCRFLTDEQEFAKMFNGMWEAKKVEFITVKP